MDQLAPPDMQQEGTSYVFQWKELALRATVAEIEQWRDGPRAEVTITDMHGGHLHMAMLNLLSTNSKLTLLKTLRQRDSAAPWEDMIEQFTVMSVQAWRAGAPMELLEPQFHEGDRYAIDQLVPSSVATLLYGDGACGKSYLANAAGRCLMLNLPFLSLATKRHNVAYLDWEWDKSEHEERLMMLGGDVMYLYRRCALPLAGEVRTLARLLDQNDVDFIIVDSLGYALGDDPSNPEAVLKFFAALRQLGRTALVVHHVPKDSRHPYGSVYIRNSVRSAWHVIRSSLRMDDGFRVALRHDKSNRGPIQPPIGVEFRFTDTTASIERTNADKIPELAEGKGIKQRILDFLKDGKADTKEIVEAVGAPAMNISPRLTDLKNAGAVMRFDDGTWGLTHVTTE